jgi:hypothetical protein
MRTRGSASLRAQQMSSYISSTQYACYWDKVVIYDAIGTVYNGEPI